MTETKKNKDRAKEKERKRKWLRLKRRIMVGTALCLLLALLLYLLSSFVFFKITKIEIVGADSEVSEYMTGSAYYLNEDIIRVSGVQIGDSLVRVRGENVEQMLERLLPYIGNVTVKKRFPSTLRLEITDTSPYFALESGGQYIVLDRDYKVLEKDTQVPDGCVKLIGISTASSEVGMELEFSDEAYAARIQTLLSACDNAQLDNVTTLDLSNIANVKIVLDSGKITFKIGTITDLEKKIALGINSMNAELAANPKAHIIINLIEGDQAYVLDDPTPYEEESDADTPEMNPEADDYDENNGNNNAVG